MTQTNEKDAPTGASAFQSKGTVLLATDFSSTADLALERAVEMATRNAARLILLHTITFPPMLVADPHPLVLPPDIDAQVREASEKRLEALAEGARARGIETQCLLVSGTPSHCIVDTAAERGVDLIVIGTRGLSGFKHLLLGSTAEQVVRRAPCPVLTVHPEDRGSLRAPRTVVVPTELGRDPSNAVELAVGVLGRAEPTTRLLLVHSDHLPACLQPFLEDIAIDRIGFEEIEQHLRDKLSPSAAKLEEAGYDVEIVVEEGDPATVISNLAQTRDADLIVMETHGRRGLSHALFGSTTERVVQHATCPVLTMHRSSEDAAAEAG